MKKLTLFTILTLLSAVLLNVFVFLKAKEGVLFDTPSFLYSFCFFCRCVLHTIAITPMTIRARAV